MSVSELNNKMTVDDRRKMLTDSNNIFSNLTNSLDRCTTIAKSLSENEFVKNLSTVKNLPLGEDFANNIRSVKEAGDVVYSYSSDQNLKLQSEEENSKECKLQKYMMDIKRKASEMENFSSFVDEYCMEMKCYIGKSKAMEAQAIRREGSINISGINFVSSSPYTSPK